jgi:hypothetical protein
MKLSELYEGGARHATFCFGRMNPPTIGHEQVFKTMEEVGGEFFIFLSQTQDKKTNPLDYSTKIHFLRQMFPKYQKNIVDNPTLNVFPKVCSYLYDQGFKHITIVAGSDRLASLKKLAEDYNGVEGKAHGFYDFETIDGKSSGERDPDSDGVSGVSASKAREAAANGQFEKFAEATGAGQYAESLYNAVRKGLGSTVKESLIVENKTIEQLQAELKNLREKMSNLEIIVQRVRSITREIKYDDVAQDIIGRIAPWIEEYGVDPSEWEDKIKDVQAAQNALESAVYSLDDPFLDTIRRLDSDIGELEWEIDEYDPGMIEPTKEAKQPPKTLKPRDPNHSTLAAKRSSNAGGAHKDKTKVIPRKEKHKTEPTTEANFPFAGAKVGQKTGSAGQLKGKMKRPARAGDLVGGS